MNNINTLAFLEPYILALCITIIIYFNIDKYKNNLNPENQFFSYLVKGTLYALLVDVVKIYANGNTGLFMYELNLVSSTMMLLLTPLVPMLWSIYIDYKIFSDKDRIHKHFAFLLVPVIVNSFFILLSFIDGTNGKFLFFIDSNNLYNRGELYNIIVVMSFSYFIYSFLCLKIHQKLIDESEYDTLLIFSLPPFIGGILQIIVPNFKITWIAMTISLFIIYINIQNKLLYIDVLTNLYNRSSLNKHFKHLFMRKRKDYFVGGILFDLNDFKYINDTFGHDEGDNALRAIGAILKNSFKDDLAFRYAGDEFVVICKVKNIDELKLKIKNLERNLSKYNSTSENPYILSMSKGYKLFKDKTEVTLESFISSIDTLMYKDKVEYKKLKRTESSIN